MNEQTEIMESMYICPACGNASAKKDWADATMPIQTVLITIKICPNCGTLSNVNKHKWKSP